MKTCYILLLMGLESFAVHAQRLEWRTGVPDTSYTTLRDYRNNIKAYPFIKIVQEQQFPNVVEQRNITYTRTDSGTLQLDAFVPKKRKRKTPAVILIHGGGWRSGSRTQHIPLAQYLAAKGIASFTVAYRLSTEAFYPAAVYDVKAAIKWLKENSRQYNIDTNKIVLLGFSAGGQLAALTGLTAQVNQLEEQRSKSTYSSKVNAVIDIDGTLSFVHPTSWEAKNPQNVGASAKWIGYPGNERLDLWKQASPLTYASTNQIPFLFLNSSVERMHAGRDDFKLLMDEKGVYTSVISFKDTPHAFCLYEPWFSPMVAHIVAFVKKVFNLNEVD